MLLRPYGRQRRRPSVTSADFGCGHPAAPVGSTHRCAAVSAGGRWCDGPRLDRVVRSPDWGRRVFRPTAPEHPARPAVRGLGLLRQLVGDRRLSHLLAWQVALTASLAVSFLAALLAVSVSVPMAAAVALYLAASALAVGGPLPGGRGVVERRTRCGAHGDRSSCRAGRGRSDRVPGGHLLAAAAARYVRLRAAAPAVLLLTWTPRSTPTSRADDGRTHPSGGFARSSPSPSSSRCSGLRYLGSPRWRACGTRWDTSVGGGTLLAVAGTWNLVTYWAGVDGGRAQPRSAAGRADRARAHGGRQHHAGRQLRGGGASPT